MAKAARARDEYAGDTITASSESGTGATATVVHPTVVPEGENSSAPAVLADDRYIRADTAVETTSDSATKKRTPEEKAAAFSRIASLRTSNALDAMRGISHLANTSSYVFTSAQVDRMLGALTDSVEALRTTFSAALEPKVEGGRRKKSARALSFKL